MASASPEADEQEPRSLGRRQRADEHGQGEPAHAEHPGHEVEAWCRAAFEREDAAAGWPSDGLLVGRGGVRRVRCFTRTGRASSSLRSAGRPPRPGLRRDRGPGREAGAGSRAGELGHDPLVGVLTNGRGSSDDRDRVQAKVALRSRWSTARSSSEPGPRSATRSTTSCSDQRRVSSSCEAWAVATPALPTAARWAGWAKRRRRWLADPPRGAGGGTRRAACGRGAGRAEGMYAMPGASARSKSLPHQAHSVQSSSMRCSQLGQTRRSRLRQARADHPVLVDRAARSWRSASARRSRRGSPPRRATRSFTSAIVSLGRTMR